MQPKSPPLADARFDDVKRGPTYLVFKDRQAALSTCTTVFAVAAWYASNSAVMISNRALMTLFGWRRPLTLTLVHMTMCAAAGKAVQRWEPQRLPGTLGPRPVAVVVLAALFCGAVVLGNVSLRYIPVSFAHATGALTPATTAMLATVVGRRESAPAYAALVPVVGGALMATRFEPEFHAAGFAAALAATLLRSGKAVLQDRLLTDPAERIDAMGLLRLMAPYAAVMLVVPVAVWEPRALAETAAALSASPQFAAMLLCNAALSYGVNVTQFIVTHRTSALSMHVLGNVKGTLASAASVAILHNAVSPQSVTGYGIAVFGSLAYGFVKKRKL